MYQFSRSLYRELAPRVLKDEAERERRQELHDACEAAVMRLARDHRHFARPEKSLFREVRRHFSLTDQLWVYRLIECHMSLARTYVANLPWTTDAFGEPRECRASTRKGDPCLREPLPGRDYCPSHKHLEDGFGTRGALDPPQVGFPGGLRGETVL